MVRVQRLSKTTATLWTAIFAVALTGCSSCDGGSSAGPSPTSENAPATSGASDNVGPRLLGPETVSQPTAHTGKMMMPLRFPVAIDAGAAPTDSGARP